jgi:hypothetical protein
MLGVDATLVSDAELLQQSLAWVMSQRLKTLRTLAQKFDYLRNKDTARARDVHNAACAFQKEFEALMDAPDGTMC